MIYFKCSQCGESMEAPASLRGQLLRCPKCGMHQTVKNVRWRKILFVMILFLVFIGIYKAGIYVGNKRGEDVASNNYTVGRREGKDVGYREGYDAALAAGATEDYKNFLKIVDDWLGPGKVDQTFKDQIYTALMKIAKENNLSPAAAIALLRAYAQARTDWPMDEATFKNELKASDNNEISDEPNTEPNTTEQATFEKMKNHIDNEIANGLIPATYGPPASKDKGYKPDYSDVDKISDELDRKEAKKWGLTLAEYGALQRSGKLPSGSREFAPETLARNSFYRSLFDVSQGNKRRPGPDTYLTPKEIKGRQKLLTKYKTLAHLQLRKEHFEKLKQWDEVEKINLKIEKISQNK